MSRKLKFERSITTENPMKTEEIQSADQVLARLIAAAYAADHPELFEVRTCDADIMGEPSPKTFSPKNSRAVRQRILTAGEDDVRAD